MCACTCAYLHPPLHKDMHVHTHTSTFIYTSPTGCWVHNYHHPTLFLSSCLASTGKWRSFPSTSSFSASPSLSPCWKHLRGPWISLNDLIFSSSSLHYQEEAPLLRGPPNLAPKYLVCKARVCPVGQAITCLLCS